MSDILFFSILLYIHTYYVEFATDCDIPSGLQESTNIAHNASKIVIYLEKFVVLFIMRKAVTNPYSYDNTPKNLLHRKQKYLHR